MVRQSVRSLALLLALSALLAGCVQPGQRFDAQEESEDIGPHETSRDPPEHVDDKGPSEEEETPPEEEPAPPSEPDPSPPAPPEEPESDAAPPAPVVQPAPRVVIALIDTGINPYHVEFRDASPESHLHPSLYIPGFPGDAKPLHLSLNAASLEEALEADAEVWESVDPDTLYYVPGTRIIGLTTQGKDGKRLFFDDHGHGTMTASRAAGATTGLAPTAKIVAIEGLGSAGVEWAGAQKWIDVQSNSWVDIVPVYGLDNERAAFGKAAETQAVFAATGNGIAQTRGAVGQPAFLAATSGTDGVIAVGGHDNGRLTPWSGTVPHVVADACWNWAADAKTLDKTTPHTGTGTSSATPFAAGAAARLILEARRLLDDHNVSHEGAVFARGAEGRVPSGPLKDGDFTLAELKAVLFRTADPRLTPTHHDGDVCDLTMTPFWTAPAGPGDVPEDGDIPPYYFVGYGAVNEHTLARSMQVLIGAIDLPERPEDDFFHDADATVRQVLG